ncbi:hypothetical protein MPL3356_140001 [Mesorhizobium plurifarium]|uniref:Uncharacterized protein n=1 Tax=Mesorhizobium plurifarium TaxID=69974 RepID=A0A090F0X5_MESPL|nr:hypothetical protein MPL3356_140001 [Mesorhizobium plurifarium]
MRGFPSAIAQEQSDRANPLVRKATGPQADPREPMVKQEEV